MYLVFLEAAGGGAVALLWLSVFERVPRGFVRFTGVCLLVLGALAVWLRVAFPNTLSSTELDIQVAAGAAALGTSLVALSLGHWYLVSPTMATRPLIRITLIILAALLVQTALFGLAFARVQEVTPLLAVRAVFGLIVPIGGTVMAWRTARIRSLDSATGLLYIVVAMVLAGEISARALFFLTGAAT